VAPGIAGAGAAVLAAWRLLEVPMRHARGLRGKRGARAHAEAPRSVRDESRRGPAAPKGKRPRRRFSRTSNKQPRAACLREATKRAQRIHARHGGSATTFAVFAVFAVFAAATAAVFAVATAAVFAAATTTVTTTSSFFFEFEQWTHSQARHGLCIGAACKAAAWGATLAHSSIKASLYMRAEWQGVIFR